MKNIFVGDFETTVDENDCRVWGWGLYDINNDLTDVGTTIDNFFDKVFQLPTKTTLYFHNLKFDGEFIFYYLFENGFTHTNERKLENNQFSTLITFMGVFYAIEIKYKGKEYKIYDSLKILSLPVKAISKAFGIEQLKGEIDYLKERPKGYELTEKEIAYIKNDVEIVGKALLYFFNQKLNKMTQASNAFFDFKDIIGKKRFEKLFPVCSNDKELRQSYKGGFTYVNPKFQDKILESGVVLDVNSLYPSVMYNYPLPYGEPIYYEGEYKKDEIYNGFIHMFRCNFEIKDGYLPTIQLKNNMSFKPTEYVTSSDNVDVTLCLTSIDYDLFMKHYDVYNVEHFGGWKFKTTDKLFKPYIEKWIKIKEQATIDGNEGLRTIAKLMLNSLYGKFALNPIVRSKNPVFDEGLVKYNMGEDEERDPVYVPVASFITSYARMITISSAQKNYDRFIYADTDSLHLIGDEIPNNIEVDPIKLGAWDFEAKFKRGRFLRAKSYIEEIYITVDEFNKLKEEKQKAWEYNENYKCYTKIKVTCAGLPKSSHKFVTFENFKNGLSVGGKLQHKRVKGGVVLKEIDFTIKI